MICNQIDQRRYVQSFINIDVIYTNFYSSWWF